MSLPPATQSKADGTPISLQRIENAKYVMLLPKGQEIYSLRYWSRGINVQAFLDVPSGKGPFPLLVYLHGGDVAQELDHWTGSPAYTAKLAAESANPGSIVFIPNYGGYGPSAGDVCSPYECSVDVENGLKALNSLYGLRLKKNATYAVGFSLGGYVAMELAAKDPQVRAAVLDSPWPGAIPFEAWVQKTGFDNLSGWDFFFWSELQNVFGGNAGSAMYKRNSVDFSAIRAPVLIIGGRNDQRNPPSLLQFLRDRMAASHVQVTFDMVPGGHAPITLQVYRIMQAWLRSRGLRLRAL